MHTVMSHTPNRCIQRLTICLLSNFSFLRKTDEDLLYRRLCNGSLEIREDVGWVALRGVCVVIMRVNYLLRRVYSSNKNQILSYERSFYLNYVYLLYVFKDLVFSCRYVNEFDIRSGANVGVPAAPFRTRTFSASLSFIAMFKISIWKIAL